MFQQQDTYQHFVFIVNQLLIKLLISKKIIVPMHHIRTDSAINAPIPTRLSAQKISTSLPYPDLIEDNEG